MEKRQNLNINQAKSKELSKGRLDELYQDINVLEVSRDGRTAFAGMAGGNLYVLELSRSGSSGKAGAVRLNRELLLADSRPILGIALSPNEQFLAITRFGLVQIFDRVGRRLISTLTKVETRLVAIDWDPRSELVVFGGVGGDIYTWNVFDGPGAGRDTLDAVEQYEGDSPVIQLAFHPSGRAFFAAQQDGRIVFWRLLRTERELGLRDDAARIDSERRGLVSAMVGSLPGQPEDLWLEDGGEKLYVSAVDGKIHRWRVRGLEPEAPISIGIDRSSNAHQLPFVISGEKRTIRTVAVRPFVTTGRGQRVSFFCPKAPEEKANPAGVSVFSSTIAQPATSGARIVNGQFQETSENTAPAPETILPVLPPLAESDRLETPIKDFSTGVDSAVLWAIQKGGTLVVFDAGRLRSVPWFEERLLRCLSQPGS